MVLIPRLNIIKLKNDPPLCDTECDGLLISFSFKLLILLLGSWALFFRYVFGRVFFPPFFLSFSFSISRVAYQSGYQAIATFTPLPFYQHFQFFALPNCASSDTNTNIALYCLLQATQGHHAPNLHLPSSGDDAHPGVHVLLLAVLRRAHHREHGEGNYKAEPWWFVWVFIFI